MEKNIAIVHFNTPELTLALIDSIRLHTKDCLITVFDNSDKRPLSRTEGVRIIDNTRGQIINFDEFHKSYPGSVPDRLNGFGSADHMLSIQKLWDYLPDGFILLDSDILLKKDISCFFDTSVAFSGSVRMPKNVNSKHLRLMPMLCWINVTMCRDSGISYFDPDRCWNICGKLHIDTRGLYDTGASFYEDCINAGLPYIKIEIEDYMVHFGAGSYAARDSWRAWLEKHRNLYDMNKSVKSKDKYLVVIPYFAGGAQGNEIEYAVAGWRKHFKEPYQIVVVGDHHDVVDTGDDITFIQCERVPEPLPGNYRPHIDFVNKFKAVHREFPDSKGFIFVADDCYAVNDFDITDVKLLKQQRPNMENYDARVGGFENDKVRTRDRLKKEGYPQRNFTTHVPYWFEWDKIEALWEKYDMEHTSYVIEDLYYNIYYPSRRPLQLNIDYDNIKCGVYRPNPRMNYIENAFRSKIWIQNGVAGWIPALEVMLSRYYGFSK